MFKPLGTYTRARQFHQKPLYSRHEMEDWPIDTIDRHALDQLKELIGGDQDALRELVETFLEEGQEIVDSLQGSLPSQNIDLLRRSAHSMKSSAQDFGAGHLATLCATLESRSRTEWPSSASVDVDSIAVAFSSARTDLERWLSEDSA